MAKKRSKALDGNLDQLPSMTAEERHRIIAEAAYYRALQRGFLGGSAEDDWLQAEQEVNRALLEPSLRARRTGHGRATTRRVATRHENL